MPLERPESPPGRAEAEDMLLGLYEDETENGDGSFFEHGGPSSERVGNDLATYPPIARRIAELQIECDQIA